MDTQQNTKPTPNEPKENAQTTTVVQQMAPPAVTENPVVPATSTPMAPQQSADNPAQPKEKFKLYYIQDSVTANLTLGRARFSEIFFGLICLISVLMVRGALNPHSYKHYSAFLAYAYVLTGAIVSFIIFFLLLSAYTHKQAGKHVSSAYKKLPSGLLVGIVGADLGISLNHAITRNLSADMNTYVVGAIGGFMGVMCLAFIIVMHEAVKKIKASRVSS